MLCGVLVAVAFATAKSLFVTGESNFHTVKWPFFLLCFDGSISFTASELANLKEKVERRESGGAGADLPAPGSAALGADKISQLTAEMRTLRRRVSEVQEEAEGLRRAKHELEARITRVEGERDAAVEQNSQVLGKYEIHISQ